MEPCLAPTVCEKTKTKGAHFAGFTSPTRYTKSSISMNAPTYTHSIAHTYHPPVRRCRSLRQRRLCDCSPVWAACPSAAGAPYCTDQWVSPAWPVGITYTYCKHRVTIATKPPARQAYDVHSHTLPPPPSLGWTFDLSTPSMRCSDT